MAAACQKWLRVAGLPGVAVTLWKGGGYGEKNFPPEAMAGGKGKWLANGSAIPAVGGFAAPTRLVSCARRPPEQTPLQKYRQRAANRL